MGEGMIYLTSALSRKREKAKSFDSAQPTERNNYAVIELRRVGSFQLGM